jgi:hypothetical protein
MTTLTRKLKHSLSKLMSLVVFLTGFSFARSTDIKRAPSIPQRIAAIQKAVKDMPAETRQPFLLRAQWGNWGNFRNWNNWANFANFNNWNNWGNWANY